jgi:hypothetical protein
VPTRLEGRPPQRRYARDGLRAGHDLQEPAGDAEADPLGLGDGGELLLLVAGELHGAFESLLKGLDLGLAAGELLMESVDAGLGGGAVDGLDDLLSLAIERLAGLVALVGHRGDVAVSTAEDGEGAGDTLRDRGHRGLAPWRPVGGSCPRLHTPRRELSTDHPGWKGDLRNSRLLESIGRCKPK